MKFSEEVTRGLYFTKNEEFENYVFVERTAIGYDEPSVVYCKVLKPESGTFICTINDFLKERGYSRVVSLTQFERNLSTPELLKELITREDSPIYDLDIEGAESKVFRREYVCGFPMVSSDGESYLPQVIPFKTQEEAEKYSNSHFNMGFKRPKVFKRILLKM